MAREGKSSYTLYFDDDLKRELQIICIYLRTDVASVIKELTRDFVKKYKTMIDDKGNDLYEHLKNEGYYENAFNIR